MRLILLSLVVTVFVLQGCEAPEEVSSPGSQEMQESPPVETSASIRVAYDIDADGAILETLQSCLKNELGAMNDVAPVAGTGDYEIRVVARDSRDFRIFSESLITLSTLVLEPALEEGDEKSGEPLYKVRDHQTTTFQSDDLGSVCQEIMEEVEGIVAPAND
ncbi:MAG: hypothetical protein GWO11_03775 [Desulfuromonadales bacterium]|nr:hypothetical protein [Desulfuromonadales bacterium]NIR33559.1 hypothetical protein [Desulfuromonadales bacterium]NIS41149.1 hypothetical protein [Desulfuromonadales bacterium]